MISKVLHKKSKKKDVAIATPLSTGGPNRARTYDPLLVRQMLSQLSYGSKNGDS